MKLDRIKEVLLLGEGQSIEFKSGCQNIEAIGRVISGFLNTSSGGYVVCGINDAGEILGVDDAEVACKTLEQALEKDLSPKTLVSVQIQKVQGKNLIVLEVPAGKDQPYAFEDVIYLRDGVETRKADVATIRDLVLRRQVEPERWERRFSSANTDKDLAGEEIHSAVTDINKTERLRFRDADNPITVLEDLSVFKYGHLTNGGDVLFTTNPALRYPQIRVRAARFSTDKTDDIYPDTKFFEGPLVTLLDDVIGFIRRNTPTSSHFKEDVLKREDKNLYPSSAIREGLVNAFAHRDYSDFSGGISVTIYPDRLEIENSGKFPEGVTPDKLAVGHISVLRNPDIAHVLYLRGFMEKMGRGSVLIQKVCADSGLPRPQWSQNERGVMLTFFASSKTQEVSRKLPGKHSGSTQEVTRKLPRKYPGSTQEVTRKLPRKYPGSTQEVTRKVERLLKVFKGDMSRQNLQTALHLKDDEYFRSAYLQPAIRKGLIEMTISDKPRSSRQKYRLTTKGQSLRGLK
ncbi:Fic family protein [Methanoregula sp.]|jgi:ATP-dependent DNA helicase RecG|uniref:Fic family protein n=1 Tax=Methanoregula sp. TaxID=2052170 RepID=UPI0025D49D78|nr:RNA-binding domain-containing protein [Methanoregula sp.]